eukprot:5035663-Amphidinium_carterae.1
MAVMAPPNLSGKYFESILHAIIRILVLDFHRNIRWQVLYGQALISVNKALSHLVGAALETVDTTVCKVSTRKSSCTCLTLRFVRYHLRS